MADDNQPRITVSAAQTVTPHNQALYEAGKKLLVDSVDTGRDFCKFMITTNLAAIPVYLGLLKLMLPDTYYPTWTAGVVLMLPPVVFMVGASLSVSGYLPRLSTFSLDLPAEIDAEREATIQRRRHFALAAAVLFAVSAILAAVIAIWSLSLTRGEPI
jgi:hypothetical protein